jgi:hypothetical protein
MLGRSAKNATLMPFPQTIREEALIACGRHCCLCHRFVGTKIECHHIKPESQGGDDTLDNCMPLCFDCHAEVEHYNPSHPKGTKFRPAELKGHRDSWIKQVGTSTPVVFDEERREVDRCLLASFREVLPEHTARELLGEHCWGQPISSSVLDKVYELARFLERIDSEFLDPVCESARAEFAISFNKFWKNNDFIQISPVDGFTDRYRLPKEWTQSSDPETRQQFFDCMNNLNSLSTEAFLAYQNFIRQCRSQLITQ